MKFKFIFIFPIFTCYLIKFKIFFEQNLNFQTSYYIYIYCLPPQSLRSCIHKIDRKKDQQRISTNLYNSKYLPVYSCVVLPSPPPRFFSFIDKLSIKFVQDNAVERVKFRNTFDMNIKMNQNFDELYKNVDHFSCNTRKITLTYRELRKILYPHQIKFMTDVIISHDSQEYIQGPL